MAGNVLKTVYHEGVASVAGGRFLDELFSSLRLWVGLMLLSGGSSTDATAAR